MAWARFDDRYPTHPKLLAAGLEATGLDARGICHCAAHETDGFIADSLLGVLAMGAKSPHKVAGRLVEVGRWRRDDENKGYWVHDFLDYNPSRDEAAANRAKKQQAGRIGGMRSARGRSKPQADGSPAAVADAQASAVANGQAPAELLVDPGVNTRPVPSRSTSSLPSSEAPAHPPEAAEEDLKTEDQDQTPNPDVVMAEAWRLLAEQDLQRQLDAGNVIKSRAGWLATAADNRARTHNAEVRPLVQRGELRTAREVVIRLGGDDPEDPDGSKERQALYEASQAQAAENRRIRAEMVADNERRKAASK